MSLGAGLKRLGKLTALVILVLLASYGLVLIVVNNLDERTATKTVETVQPFVSGVASAAGKKAKESLMATPDKQLEQEGEELGRKLYPATKGFIKGQLESFAQDPDRKQIGKKIFDATREISKDVVAPFGDKLEEQSQAVLRELDQTLQGVKKLRNDNKDLIEGLASGIETILKTLKQAAPPPHREAGAP